MGSTLNRAHQQVSVGQTGMDHVIGRSKGGPTTKVSIQNDALGNPLSFELIADNVHDMKMVEALVNHSSVETLLWDKGYVSASLRARLIESGKTPIVSMKSKRLVSKVRRPFNILNHSEKLFR